MRSLMLILTLILTTLTARADCMVSVGSYQRGGPRHAHTFTVVERDGVQLTISWMPQGKVHLLSGPVPGCNWTLERTLAHASAISATVQWEPAFVASDEFWEQFRQQVELLEGGAILYIAIGERHHPGSCNCIGACLRVTGERPHTRLQYGHKVSPTVRKHLEHHGSSHNQRPTR